MFDYAYIYIYIHTYTMCLSMLYRNITCDLSCKPTAGRNLFVSLPQIVIAVYYYVYLCVPIIDQ